MCHNRGIYVAYRVKAQNFSGHYVQASKEMIDGKEYLNAIANDITVVQTKDSIKIIRLTPSGQGQVSTSVETLPASGTPLVTTTSSKRKRLCPSASTK